MDLLLLRRKLELGVYLHSGEAACLVCAPFAPKSNNPPKPTLACYSILWWCTTGRQARKRLWCKTHCIQRQINAQALPCTKSPNTTAPGKELNCGWCRCYCFIKAKHFLPIRAASKEYLYVLCSFLSVQT